MAATVSSPWSKPGAWALDAEEHESELQSQQPQNDVADFPSLSAATKQPKKKKTQTVSLAEFNAPKPSHEPSRLTHDELLSLPTGPRQRAPEELERNRLGGGFKSYGANSRNSEDSRYSRGPRESNRELPPSRADEIDDWSKAKKSSGLGFERRERERGSSFFESHSRADESDNWASNKTVETRRFSGGSSFERRGSFDSLSRGREGERNGFGGSDSDSWMKRDNRESSDGGAGGARPKLLLQPRTLPVYGNGNALKPKGSNPFGDARPREEVLAEKGMDRKEIDEKLEAMKINGNGNDKEGEKGRRGSDSGSRWSFGSFGNERGGERAWRKPDSAESGSSPQSVEKAENGERADENGVATDNGNTEEN